MPDGQMVLEGLLAFGVAVLLTPPVVAWLRRAQLLDHPNHRSSHVAPTPRGGGVAVVVALLCAAAVTPRLRGEPLAALVVGAAMFGALGLLDDLRGIPALQRLATQFAVALIVLALVLDGGGAPLVPTVLLGLALVVWLVGFVNAFNFMDGINGISAAQAIVAGLTWAILGWRNGVDSVFASGAIVAGAALGFAPFNFPRARVFLGDVGSYCLGAWLAITAIVAVDAGLWPGAVVAPLALYVCDTAATVVRRVRQGERWYEAHREHTYQRLVALGWSHERTTAVVALLMASPAAVAVLAADDARGYRLLACGVLAAVLLGYLAMPSALAGMRMRKA